SMVSIRQIRSGISIDIQGEVTKYSEDTLLHAVDWSETSPDFIIFNFKDVAYINSAGISIIIRMIRSCIDNEILIFGHGISTLQEKLFKAVGITEYILFYPDEYSIMQRIESVNFTK